MSDFLKGVGATVIAGVILFLVTTALKSPLTPAPDLQWGVFQKSDLPVEFQDTFDVRTQYQILLENWGGATARKVDLYFEAAPKFVSVPDGSVFSWRSEGGFEVLGFDAITAGNSAVLRVFDQHGVGPVAVRVQGEPIYASPVTDANFGRRVGIFDWGIYLVIGLMAAAMASLTWREFFPNGRQREEQNEQREKVKKTIAKLQTAIDAIPDQIPEKEERK